MEKALCLGKVPVIEAGQQLLKYSFFPKTRNWTDGNREAGGVFRKIQKEKRLVNNCWVKSARRSVSRFL